MSEYPVQLSRVQAPPLREETLARDRLLEWLAIKIHRRAVLLIAEAGYGKTTLLADFTRRTRIRVLWFRLDRADRDWTGFIAYLVAAMRIHEPEFGAATSALLRETATAAPSMETVFETFLRELIALPNEPTAIVFDDFHLVDDASDVRHLLRELLNRAPERMSFVFASRREPPIRLARLRALGEVAELHTDDLRFRPDETERLFRETYAMRLEPAVLAELSRRTEGWAASLQLVRSALHDRDPGQVRAFIASLSGAEGHLYEYLAEEVVGELPLELQQFLMRTSVLDTVDLRLGPIAAEVDVSAARRLIEDGERHGLLGKGGPNLRHVARAHPLVRDFLQDRLLRQVGDDGVKTIHLAVAEAAEPISWLIAARHYIAAGHDADAHRVLAGAIEPILATGSYAAAQDLASQLPSGGLSGSAGLVLQSRLAQQRAAVTEGRDLAEQAWQADPTSMAVLLNLASARSLAGDVEGALEAGRLLEERARPELAALGRVFQRVLETSVNGSLDLAVRELEALAEASRARGDTHYLGVALLNLAYIRTAMDAPFAAVDAASEAIAHLAEGSAGVDLVSARLSRAAALAYAGDLDEARLEAERAIASAPPGQALEVAAEVGLMEALLGDPSRARPLLDRVASDIVPSSDQGEQALMSEVLVQIRDGDISFAEARSSNLRYGDATSATAFDARRYLTRGLVMALGGIPGAEEQTLAGLAIARSQGALLWERYGLLLHSLEDRLRDPSPTVIRVAEESPAVVSMLAEIVLARARDLDPSAKAAIADQAERRPERWRTPVRRLLESNDADDRELAGNILEAIGEVADIRRLRDSAKRHGDQRRARPGFRLARRLAGRVLVEDLGRVRIIMPGRTIEGAEVRRKVLALLCLLLSKPSFSSTREEVVDSLWPDLEPSAAFNSLNQTVYFLRRVFEPEYSEETSPVYVGQDGEMIWLDSELVDGRSRRCFEIIRANPGQPSPEAALDLATEYQGRFAMDFAYDDWAASFRDSLHAGYLRVTEHAIRMDIDAGHLGRGTFLAERAIDVDPDAEAVHASLVRLYRLSGAHAAAAEQYALYARAVRDLGLEPEEFTDM